MKILAFEGLTESGIELLEKNNFEVITTKVAQSQLENFINENSIDAIIVKNTQITQEIIEGCPSLKLIGKAGIDMENIDVSFAIDNGLHVVNTPEATSQAIAELVFAHLFGMSRFLHSSNREMPLEGDTRFKDLKKAYTNGIELKGKTLGIIGFGAIGQEVAKTAIGLGMSVLAYDNTIEEATLALEFYNKQQLSFTINTVNLEDVLTESDFITLHLTDQEEYAITSTEINKMKDGVGIINTAFGGLINEVDLVQALKDGKVQFAGLDVFMNEPQPAVQLLMHPEISLSPNLATSTMEANVRMSTELAQQIIKILK